jgi:hypothetical protein
VTNSTTEIVTNSTTEIVTNSTTGIPILKLLSGTKCKVFSTGHDEVCGGVEVWFLSLTYALVKGQWLNARTDRSVRFQIQTDSFGWQHPVLYFLSVQCYINRHTQHYRYNILTVYSTLLYISAVHITHHQVSPNKQQCTLL